MKKRKQGTAVALVCLMLFLLCGCGGSRETRMQKKFDLLMEQEFVTALQADYLAAHVYLKQPESYGVTPKKLQVSLGFRPTKENFVTLRQELANSRQKLHEIDRSLLSVQQQDTFDLYQFKLDAQSALYEERFDTYHCFFDPVAGVHVQLPTQLIEFRVQKEKDLQALIILLADTKDYLSTFTAYARTQKEQQTLLADCTQVSAYCASLAADGADSQILSEIQALVERVPLGEDKKADYKEQIRRAFIQSFVPAYQNTADVMAQLAQDGEQAVGYGMLPEGKAYYEALVQARLGTSKTVEELHSALDKMIEHQRNIILDIGANHPEAVQVMLSDSFSSPYTDYEQTLSVLEQKIKADFPDIGTVAYHVGVIPEPTAGKNVAAYFVIPPLDSKEPRTIKVNTHAGMDNLGNVDTFLILAHEGFPGHLYQSAYAAQKLADQPWRIVLTTWNGYSEGYASYVQLHALDYLDLDRNAAAAFRASKLYQWCIIAQLELGIHYEGWSVQEENEYLKRYNMADTVGELYQNLAYTPGRYLAYYAGCAQFEMLRIQVEQSLEERFDTKAFHAVILDDGYVTFEKLEEKVEAYSNVLSENLKNAAAV